MKIHVLIFFFNTGHVFLGLVKILGSKICFIYIGRTKMREPKFYVKVIIHHILNH